jgi:hypothetical protein
MALDRRERKRGISSVTAVPVPPCPRRSSFFDFTPDKAGTKLDFWGLDVRPQRLNLRLNEAHYTGHNRKKQAAGSFRHCNGPDVNRRGNSRASWDVQFPSRGMLQVLVCTLESEVACFRRLHREAILVGGQNAHVRRELCCVSEREVLIGSVEKLCTGGVCPIPGCFASGLRAALAAEQMSKTDSLTR